MPKPAILCFCMKPERLTRLSFLCAGLGIAVTVPSEEERALPLGAICGSLPGIPPKAPTNMLPAEMIVFAHLTDAQLDEFLTKWKQTGLAPVRLKAVLTDTNRFWTPAVLQAQLLAEERRMSEAASG